MDSSDRQILKAVRNWAAQGHRLALVTVARTWGSAPRPAGAWMAIRDDGRVQGSVSGGCIEDDLINHMLAGQLAGTLPLTRTYGGSQAESARFGLPCAGTLELVIEPHPEVHLLAQIEKAIALGRSTIRSLDIASGQVSVEDAAGTDTMSWDGKRLRTMHGPAWRLLLIGAGQISRYLAEMAQAMDYAVTVCDPRQEYRQGWDVPGATLADGMPDDVVLAMQPDPQMAVLALSHDPKLDDLALLEALKSPAFYVGALGSRANSARRRERLRKYFDLDTQQVDRLHGPVGLPIGSRTSPEIAISILAEMTAAKYGLATGRAAEVECPAHPHPAADIDAAHPGA